jgi:two-component system chemotaxis sensor kinase CheA
LTLAIIDGLLIQVGNTHFVLPQAQVEECMELTGKDIERFHGRHVFAVRDHIVPYVRLRDFFEIDGQRPRIEQVVIVNINGERLGLVLDNVVGGHQTVIKNLGWAYRKAEGVSGATILGSGEVALIIDVVDLARYAHLDETSVAH